MTAKLPEFIGGPKDGAPVPDVLWVLDVLDLIQDYGGKKFIHRYQLDYDNKMYYYKGMIDDNAE